MTSLRGSIADGWPAAAHPSAWEQRKIEFPDCPGVSRCLSVTLLLWVTLSKLLKPDNLILLYGHVFVFQAHWRGRLSRSKVGRKDNAFERKASQPFKGIHKKNKIKRVKTRAISQPQIIRICPRMRFALPLILNTLLVFSYRAPVFIKMYSRSVQSPAEKLNTLLNFSFHLTSPL